MLRDVAVRLQRHFGRTADDPRPLDGQPSIRHGALVDAAVAAYVEWREESGAVRLAYERWDGARPADRTLAAAAYVAALDREERAAAAHASLLADVTDVLGRRRGIHA
jgi:hypothetical protein